MQNVIGVCKRLCRSYVINVTTRITDDYVITTSKTHPIKEFVKRAFDGVGLNWEKYMVIHPKFVRSAEVELLMGDASKIIRGWERRLYL